MNSIKEVTFECALGAEIVRDVDLRNKSNKKITYRPKFVNTNAVFSFANKHELDLVIPPKSSIKLTIRFKPKFLVDENGILLVSGIVG